MIALLDAERIKLTTTRAAWWSLALVVVGTLGFAVLSVRVPIDGPPSLVDAQAGGLVGQIVLMILAVVTVTGEHRFGTVRAAYVATPQRWRVLTAKLLALSLLGLVAGTVLAFASAGLAAVLNPEGDYAIRSATDWRLVVGVGLSHAVSVAIAVAVAVLLRHAAGAITVLLLWMLVLEASVVFLPGGENLLPLMPFQAQSYFLGQVVSEFPYPPVFGIVYAGAVAAVLMTVAVLVSERRDAA